VSDSLAVVRVDREPHRVIVTVAGEVDMTNASDLGRQIDEAADGQHGVLFVDLGAVEFMDSQGVYLLAQFAQRPDVELVVVAPPGCIAYELIMVTDLAALVTVRNSLDGP